MEPREGVICREYACESLKKQPVQTNKRGKRFVMKGGAGGGMLETTVKRNMRNHFQVRV